MASSNPEDVLVRTVDQWNPKELSRMCSFLESTYAPIQLERTVDMADEGQEPIYVTEQYYNPEIPAQIAQMHLLIKSLCIYAEARRTVQPTLF